MSLGPDVALAAAAAAACFEDSDFSDDDSSDDNDGEKSMIDFHSDASSFGSIDDDNDAEEEEDVEEEDGCGDFLLEDILYGRDEEIETMHSIHKRLLTKLTDNDGEEQRSNRRISESVLICGEEGVGRSALLHAMRDLFLQQSDCLVLSGRFLPSQQNNNSNFCWDVTSLKQQQSQMKPTAFQFPPPSFVEKMTNYKAKNDKMPTNLILLVDDLQYASQTSLQYVMQLLHSTTQIQNNGQDDEYITCISTIPITFIASCRVDHDENNLSSPRHDCHDTPNCKTSDNTITTIADDNNNSTTDLASITNQFQQSNLSHTTLNLNPLSSNTIHSLISDFLSIHTTFPLPAILNLSRHHNKSSILAYHSRSTSVSSKTIQTQQKKSFHKISKLMYQYTSGNPKKVYEFLEELVQERMLAFIQAPPASSSNPNNSHGGNNLHRSIHLQHQSHHHNGYTDVNTEKWMWDSNQIQYRVRQRNISNIQTMADASKAKKEEEKYSMKNVMTITSFLGMEFDLDLLRMAYFYDRDDEEEDDSNDDDDESDNDNDNDDVFHAFQRDDNVETAPLSRRVCMFDDESYLQHSNNDGSTRSAKKLMLRMYSSKKKWNNLALSFTSKTKHSTEKDHNLMTTSFGEEGLEHGCSKQQQKKRRVRIRPRHTKSDSQDTNNDGSDINSCNRGNVSSLSQHDITATTVSSSTMEMTTTSGTNTPVQHFPNTHFPNIIQKEEESKQEIDNTTFSQNGTFKDLLTKENTPGEKLVKIINKAVDEGMLEMIRIPAAKRAQTDSFTLHTNSDDKQQAAVRSESMSSVKAQQSSLDFHLALQPTSQVAKFFADLGPPPPPTRTDKTDDTTSIPTRPHPPHRRPKLQRRPSILPPIKYKFTDAQIQSVAYSSLVPNEEQRNEVHARIGESLLSRGKAEHKLERSAVLFTTVDQFNHGTSSSYSSFDGYDFEKKTVLADLNLRAARRATEKLSFKLATTYVDSGINMLDCDETDYSNNDDGGEEIETDDCQQHWKLNYNLCLELYTRCASLAYYNGDFTKVERINQKISRHVKCPIDALRSRVALINSLNARTKYKEALEVGFAFLSQLGYKISQKSSVRRVTLVSALFQLKVVLGNHSRASKDFILRLPRMVSGTKYAAAMEAFNALLVPAYIERRDIALLTALKMVRLTLRKGLCGLSAIAFAAYGKGLAYTLGDFDGAFRYGQIALAIIEKMDAQYLLPRVHWMVYGYIHHWKNHLQMSLDALFVGYQTGMDYGATECAFLSAQEYCILYFYAGLPLDPICQDMKMFVEQIVRLKQDFVKTTFLLLWQSILNLMRHQPWENEDDRLRLTGDAMDEKVLKETTDHNNTMSIMYHCKMWLAYYFGDYEFAAKMIDLAKGYEKQTNGHFAVCKHHFFVGLISVAMARKVTASGGTPSKWKVRAKKELKRLESWAEGKAVNCLHLLFLLQAEYASLEEESDKVQKAYDNAISTASRHGFYQDKALAYERAGVYFFEKDDKDRAEHYIRSAHEAYTCWGAQAKADHLRSIFSLFLKRRRMSTGMCSIRGRSRFSTTGVIRHRSFRETQSV